MEFQSGYSHFGSSPRVFLGQIQSELPTGIAVSHECMQEGDKEEELPLYYHDPEYSAAGGDPIRQMQERLMRVEHNIETLRTRVTQVADLRDAQGIRRDHHSIVARLNEVEEYASANTFRELMTRIQRLESMLVGNGGGTVEDAQAKIKGLDKYSQMIVQHEHRVNQTIDQNTHSQSASMSWVTV